MHKRCSGHYPTSCNYVEMMGKKLLRDERWMGFVKDDMSKKEVNSEITTDIREWKRKTCCAAHIARDEGIIGR